MDFDTGYFSSPSPGPSFAGEETLLTGSGPAESGVDAEAETGGRRDMRPATEPAEFSAATLEFISEAPAKDRALAHWSLLFPHLKAAYLRGIADRDPDIRATSLDYRTCPCASQKLTKTVKCMFECGMIDEVNIQKHINLLY